MAVLEQQISAVLTQPCASSDANAVLDSALAELRSLEAQAEVLDTESLSPLLSLKDATAKRNEASDTRWKADRLDASCSALRDRVAGLQAAEKLALRQAEREAAMQERDELAAEIAADYPAIVRKLTSWVKRISESDARCDAAGIAEKAETIGRALPSNAFRGDTASPRRLFEARLPLPGHGLAWDYGSPGKVIYPGLDA